MSYRIINCIEDNIYRYSLEVLLDSKGKKRLILFQCNPSNADSRISDPTVGKVCNWAEENDYHRISFLNLFAYRASKTEHLSGKNYNLIVGPNNDKTIRASIDKKATIVLAWGGNFPNEIQEYYRQRVLELKRILNSFNVFKVGKLSYGRYPRHGLMWNGSNRKLSELSWEEIGF